MASTEAIEEAWRDLRAGLRPPPSWSTDEGLAEAERVWSELFRAVPDAHLEEAVRVHLQRSKFWPAPAELLALVPRREAQVLKLVERWALGEIEDGHTRLQLLEQAMTETAGACGRQRCPIDCGPCTEAANDRVDELARAHLVAAGAA